MSEAAGSRSSIRRLSKQQAAARALELAEAFADMRLPETGLGKPQVVGVTPSKHRTERRGKTPRHWSAVAGYSGLDGAESFLLIDLETEVVELVDVTGNVLG